MKIDRGTHVLAAEVAGTVREVHATPGGMVDAGAVVVVVAPSAA